MKIHLPHRLPSLRFPERMRRTKELFPPKPSCGGEAEVDGPERGDHNVQGWFRSGVPPGHCLRGEMRPHACARAYIDMSPVHGGQQDCSG